MVPPFLCHCQVGQGVLSDLATQRETILNVRGWEEGQLLGRYHGNPWETEVFGMDIQGK